MEKKVALRGLLAKLGSIVIVLDVLLMTGCLARLHGNEVQENPPDTQIVFQGTVLKLAPDPGTGSGSALVVYQLARYRVDRVCRGSYSEKEITVDHLILSGKELEGVKVGDRLCVTVEKRPKVFNRWNSPGIREESDVVEMFYLGGEAKPSGQPDCNKV